LVSIFLHDNLVDSILLHNLQTVIRKRKQDSRRNENDGNANIQLLHCHINILLFHSAHDLTYSLYNHVQLYFEESLVFSLLHLFVDLLHELSRTSLYDHSISANQKELISGFNLIPHSLVLHFICYYGSSHQSFDPVQFQYFPKFMHESMHKTIFLVEFEYV
jgi:hypothetical protein